MFWELSHFIDVLLQNDYTTMYVFLGFLARIKISWNVCLYDFLLLSFSQFSCSIYIGWMCSKCVEFFLPSVSPKFKLISHILLLLCKVLSNFLQVFPIDYFFLRLSCLLQRCMGWPFCYTLLLFFFSMWHLLWRLFLFFIQWDQARLCDCLLSGFSSNFQFWRLVLFFS